MINMSIEHLAACFNQEVPASADGEFCGVSIDSRTDCSGKLFIAIRGENFNGFDYLQQAIEQGAVVAMLEKPSDLDIPQIIVKDTTKAMASLSSYWRLQCQTKVIALTGSNGKTTVKEMLFQILRQHGKTLATRGNMNNTIGVPLTLFELSADDQFAIIEMGANNPGEISYLAQITRPNIVYVTNAALAHLDGFNTLEGVVEAKGELYDWCRKQTIAVFNVDEQAAVYWKSICKAEKIYNCSMNRLTDVSGSWRVKENGLLLTLKHKHHREQSMLQVYGEHNARNALAAASLAIAAGLSLPEICHNLQDFAPIPGRLQMLCGPNSSRLIDDTYNANPESLKAGVDVLTSLPGEAWLALGDMAELGDDAKKLHQEAVIDAIEAGVSRFFAIGDFSCAAANEFGEDGLCFQQLDEMADVINKEITKEVNLLVKGSRSAGMEQLVQVLIRQQKTTGGKNAL